MKHRNLGILFILSVFAATVFAAGFTSPAMAADFQWKFQSHHTPGSLAVESVIKPFIERVEKMSGGRLKMSLH